MFSRIKNFIAPPAADNKNSKSVKIVVQKQRRTKPTTIGPDAETEKMIERGDSQESVDSCYSARQQGSSSTSSIQNETTPANDLVNATPDVPIFPIFPHESKRDSTLMEVFARLIDVGDEFVRLLSDNSAPLSEFLVRKSSFPEEPILSAWYEVKCKVEWSADAISKTPLMNSCSIRCVPQPAGKFKKRAANVTYHGLVLRRLENKHIAWIFEEHQEMLISLPDGFEAGHWFIFYDVGQRLFKNAEQPFKTRLSEEGSFWQILVPVVSPSQLDEHLTLEGGVDLSKRLWSPAVGSVDGEWPAHFPKNVFMNVWVTRSTSQGLESKGNWTFRVGDNTNSITSSTNDLSSCFSVVSSAGFTEGIVVKKTGKTPVILSDQGQMCCCACQDHDVGDHIEFLVWNMNDSQSLAVNCLCFCKQFLEATDEKDEFHISLTVDKEDIEVRQYSYPGIGLIHDDMALLEQKLARSELDATVAFRPCSEFSSPPLFKWVLTSIQLRPRSSQNSSSADLNGRMTPKAVADSRPNSSVCNSLVNESFASVKTSQMGEKGEQELSLNATSTNSSNSSDFGDIYKGANSLPSSSTTFPNLPDAKETANGLVMSTDTSSSDLDDITKSFSSLKLAPNVDTSATISQLFDDNYMNGFINESSSKTAEQLLENDKGKSFTSSSTAEKVQKSGCLEGKTRQQNDSKDFQNGFTSYSSSVSPPVVPAKETISKHESPKSTTESPAPATIVKSNQGGGKIVVAVILHLSAGYATLFSLDVALPNFQVPTSKFPRRPKLGSWYSLTLASVHSPAEVTRSGNVVVKVSNIATLSSVPIRTRIFDEVVELLTEVYVGNRSKKGFRYCYSTALSVLLDTNGLLANSRVGTIAHVWCCRRKTPIHGMHWKIVRVEKEEKRPAKVVVAKVQSLEEGEIVEDEEKQMLAQPSSQPVNHFMPTTELKEVKAPRIMVNSISPQSVVKARFQPVQLSPKEELPKSSSEPDFYPNVEGIVCSRITNHGVDYFVVHCYAQKFNAVLEITNGVVYGDWIRFSANNVKNVLRIKEYEPIAAKLKAIPTQDQLLVPCELDIPMDFDLNAPEGGTLSSEYFPLISDTNKLISPRQLGSRVRAVFGCNMATTHPNRLTWSIVHLY